MALSSLGELISPGNRSADAHACWCLSLWTTKSTYKIIEVYTSLLQFFDHANKAYIIKSISLLLSFRSDNSYECYQGMRLMSWALKNFICILNLVFKSG